jgi:hypothetical protein
MKTTLTGARRGLALYAERRIPEFDKAEAELGRAMRRFLGNAARVAAAGVRPLSEDGI